MDPQRVPIPGSELADRTLQGRTLFKPSSSDAKLTVTVIVRRPPTRVGPSAEELLAGTAKPQSREQAEAAMSADPADLRAVREFAGQYRLKVIQEMPAARQIKLRGTTKDMELAFGTTLGMEGNGGQGYLTYRGLLSVPSFLAGIVVAVLGLDQKPAARH